MEAAEDRGGRYLRLRIERADVAQLTVHQFTVVPRTSPSHVPSHVPSEPRLRIPSASPFRVAAFPLAFCSRVLGRGEGGGERGEGRGE